MERVKVTLAFQKADGVDVKPNNFERLIKWWTKSDYYHVEVIINNIWLSSLSSKGFRMNELRPLKDTYDYHTFETTLTDKQYNDMWEWLHKQVGNRYDWYGLVMAQIFGVGVNNEDEWICSEAATKILQWLLEPKVMDLTPIRVAPGDLARIYKVGKHEQD